MTLSELLKLRLPGQHNLVQSCVIITPGKLTTASHFCDQEQVTHSPEHILENIIASSTVVTISFPDREIEYKLCKFVGKTVSIKNIVLLSISFFLLYLLYSCVLLFPNNIHLSFILSDNKINSEN